MTLKKEKKLKTAEKLKRIKLIAQTLFTNEVSICEDKKDIQLYAKASIVSAGIFVDEFEKFEDVLNQVIESEQKIEKT